MEKKYKYKQHIYLKTHTHTHTHTHMLNSNSLPRGARQLLHYLGKELAAVLSEALEKAATKGVHAENQWEGNCPPIYY